MRDYELTVLFVPELSDKELDKEIKKLVDALEKAGAKVARKADPVKKPLAYQIAKKSEAHYVYLELQVPPDKLGELDQKVKAEEKIIRYLYVRKIA